MYNRLPPTVTRPLPELPSGWSALAYGILQDGTLAILADDQQIAAMYFGPHLYPDFRDRVDVARASLWSFDGQELRHVFESALETPYPLVAKFNDGRWLVVAARTPGQPNARIFSPAGDLQGRIMLGDAVQAISVDSNDTIWVGWFDEGIDQDWVVEGRERSPSSSGLACFDCAGTVVWEAKPSSYIECDGLNVKGDEAWMLAGYLETSIRCFSRTGTSLEWAVDLPPVSALAVQGDHALASGGFGPDLDVVLVKLSETTGEVIGHWILDAPQQSRSAASLLVGQGSQLHQVSHGQWRQWDVREVRRRQ